MKYAFIAAIIIALVGCEKPDKPFQSVDFRTFDREIDASAPGCFIRSPNGELMNQVFKDAPPGTVNLQSGSTITIDCFPVLASEKSVFQKQD
ncbi:hypothetical protein ACKU3Z_029930 [Pseudomonas aeruginosa]|nr:hypothetical protein [Pseudomonas aeruginosa]